MQLPKAISNNLRFLVVEVESQLSQLHAYLESQIDTVGQRIIKRSGYAYNLMQRIQNACNRYIVNNCHRQNMQLNTVSVIANELERITQLARDCVQQIKHLSSDHQIELSVYLPLIKKIIKSTQLIELALIKNDTRLALKLSKAEHKIDKSYRKILKTYTTELKKQQHTEDLVTALFIAHAIEQMGDCLLNISESIISNNIGQPLDLQRFQSLRDTLNNWLDEDKLAEIELAQIAETRSGSGISSVQYIDDNNEQQLAIFKDGERKKLKEEFDGVKRWHRIFPGVAPQILTYKKTGDNAALLIEHLEGITFEEIVLNVPEDIMQCSLQALAERLTDIWQTTKKNEIANAAFCAQTQKRMADVYAIHPEFSQHSINICGHAQYGLNELLKHGEALETAYPAPFTVFIHGDFNVDNIIYNHPSNKINFIDVHRSRYQDYVQDVSVFMVSHYRLQVFDTRSRQRINQQIINFYRFAQSFAEKHNDTFFEIRLAFGLARSFATSTRFILDRNLSQNMFYRAQYILAQVNKLNFKQAKKYKLPILELFSG
ncbi:PhoU domain-containing protein [Catenovulum sediminis]|uniref:PhoU domain-containing protein n=1 Tax=Catenovulum sediminis TaxID=1740262 RepID=A0ABV1RE04_9ALTE